jgi:ribosomal protein L32
MGALNWGKCSICGELAEPSHTCRMCGAVTCTKCTMTTIGMCRNCGRKVNAHLDK